MTPADLNQARPGGGPPAEVSSAFLLVALGRSLREQIEAALRHEGLTLAHFSALAHLSRDPGVSYSELARRAHITPQSMQATLRQLEERGAVERRTPTGRGRTAQLHPTDLGRDLLIRARGVFRAVDERLLLTVPDDQRANLSTLLLDLFLAEAGRGPAPQDASDREG